MTQTHISLFYSSFFLPLFFFSQKYYPSFLRRHTLEPKHTSTSNFFLRSLSAAGIVGRDVVGMVSGAVGGRG